MSLETFITAAFMVFVSIVGSAGNLLVILAILYKRRLRTIPNYFLFDLAVCDLLTASLAIPLRLVEGFQPGSIPCSIVISVTVLFDGLSRINIIFISIDRFVAVKFPFAYNVYITQITAAVSMASGWVIMAVFAILPVLGVGSAPTEILRKNNQGLCFFSTNLAKAYLLVFLIGFCLLPLLLATPINCFLLKASHRQMRVIHEQHINVESTIQAQTNSLEFSATTVTQAETGCQSNTARQQNRRKFILRQRKIAKMVVVLVGLFILLVLPITLIDLLAAFGQSSIPSVVAKIAVCMIYTNTTINVFVYAGFNGEFRRTFGQIIQAGRARFVSLFVFANC